MSASRSLTLAAMLSLMAAPILTDSAFAGDGDGELVASSTHAARAATVTALAQASDAKPTATATTSQTTAARLDSAPSVAPDSGRRPIHGVAGVSIGTGGYSSAYVAADIPVGDRGTLGVAVSETDYGKTNVYYNPGYGQGYGQGYGRGYGYGYGGYGRGWAGGFSRGGKSQSIAVSLDMSGDNHNGPDTPAGCAPGFRDNGRYVEPVWVTRMRGPGVSECTETLTDDRP